MPIRFPLFSIGILLLLNSCQLNSPAGAPLNEPAYVLESIPGSELSYASLYDSTDNQLLERGYQMKGLKTGTWEYYEPNKEFPHKMISWANGMYNGPYVEYSDRGHTELLAHYRNNKLHGLWTTYKFGDPTVTATYKDGQLNGVYREFDQSGKTVKEVSYQDGQQHGFMRYYNEAGEVTLEYEYSHGKKISGGIK